MAIQDTGTFELLLAKAQQTHRVLSENLWSFKISESQKHRLLLNLKLGMCTFSFTECLFCQLHQVDWLLGT